MSAKQDAQNLVQEVYQNCTDFIDSKSAANEASIVFSIICVDEKIKTFYDLCGHNSVFYTSQEVDVIKELFDLKTELENI